MRTTRTNRQDYLDWSIILIIILIGFLCLLASGWMALRFSSSWELPADMGSNLDPNSDFLTHRPSGFIEPVDPSILTPPTWMASFLTPGIVVPTNPPLIRTTSTPDTRNTAAPNTQVATTTATSAATSNSPTSTLPFIFIPTRTNTPNSAPATRTPTVTRTPAASRTPTITPTVTNTPTATATATNTALPVADLQITKDDNRTACLGGDVVTYTVIVSNAGPSNVVGATVNDTLPAQIASWTWSCTQFNGASGCDPVINSATAFNDIVDLPNGASIQYTVTANIAGGATGNLDNTATITEPVGINDTVPVNNSDNDVDEIIVPVPFPAGNIDDTKDTMTTTIPPGGSLTLTFNTPVVVPGNDLVYYELQNGVGIAMDFIILEISDGSNWYTVFNWGNANPDTNSNLDTNVIGGTETDNRDFQNPPQSDVLFNGTGVYISLNGVVPPGTYTYIRITSPTGDDGDGAEVDAIDVVP